MNTYKVMLVLGLVLVLGSSCSKKPDLKNTLLAAEAMERARDAEAPIYAKKEYDVADKLYKQMQDELNKEQFTDANNTALLVIDAANLATRIARMARSTEK